ncbi:MAG: hypothetical protein MJ247_02075 [Alphaproteobacteria bacterium]|nr:hypothetical protein [Alphaproteobacteria bacterium]
MNLRKNLLLSFLILSGLTTSACSSVSKINNYARPDESLPWNMSKLTAFGILEGASYLATDRTVGDHISSWITGKDCSIVRSITGEGKYCMNDVELYRASLPKYSTQTIYCYKSLASNVCYTEPSKNPNDVLTGTYERPLY